MANTITTTLVESGQANYMFRVDIQGDGSGEITATRINAVTGDMGAKSNRILEVKAELSGFSATLLWDATTPVMAFQIPSDMNTHQCYIRDSGILNPNASGVTGDLKITTSGLGTGDTGHIDIWVRKI